MTALQAIDLCTVTGGAAATMNDNAFGRCGPGTSWKFLGNIYTPECRAHDASVRSLEANGGSHVLAQLRSLPLLPAAIGSYIRARL